MRPLLPQSSGSLWQLTSWLSLLTLVLISHNILQSNVAPFPHVSERRVPDYSTCWNSWRMNEFRRVNMSVCVCVGGGGRRTDKCWGQRLRQACPLEGRRSSWAECIYRAAFLRIGLLSNWAPVAPRHPHPPVVGDLCGGAAALRSRLRLLSLFNQSAARKYIFEVLVLQIHVSLLF